MFEAIPLALRYVIIAVVSYLIGSFNTAIVVSRKSSFHDDIRNYGSGNAGSTNAYRVLGAKKGAIVAAGDILKCGVSVLFGQLIMGGTDISAGVDGRLVAGVFTVIGHIFPVYFKFKGGKGAMTSAANALFFDWRIFLLVMIVFIIILFATRYVSLGSICGSVMFMIGMIIFYGDALKYIAVGIFFFVCICFMHRTNIKRLLSGTESKFYFRKKQKSE